MPKYKIGQALYYFPPQGEYLRKTTITEIRIDKARVCYKVEDIRDSISESQIDKDIKHVEDVFYVYHTDLDKAHASIKLHVKSYYDNVLERLEKKYSQYGEEEDSNENV